MNGLTEDQKECFLEFASRCNFGTFRDIAEDQEEAYAMRNAVYAVGKALREQKNVKR